MNRHLMNRERLVIMQITLIRYLKIFKSELVTMKSLGPLIPIGKGKGHKLTLLVCVKGIYYIYFDLLGWNKTFEGKYIRGEITYLREKSTGISTRF